MSSSSTISSGHVDPTAGNHFLGAVLKDRYILAQKLGYGSFSSVWMAYDLELNILVAIKIVHDDSLDEGKQEVRMYDLISKVKSPYLLQMIDTFEIKKKHEGRVRDYLAIVLPLMACSAYQIIKCDVFEHGLPLEIVLRIMHQTALAVKALHDANIMHTDMKPENILICGLSKNAERLFDTIEEKNVYQKYKEAIKASPRQKAAILDKISQAMVKECKKSMDDNEFPLDYPKLRRLTVNVCDFNTSMPLNDACGDDKECHTTCIQTHYYRAPEVLTNSGIHRNSETWSLGCIFFELLTGDLLFDPEEDDPNVCRDQHHLHLIEEMMGGFPHKLTSTCEYYKDGKLAHLPGPIKHLSIRQVLEEDYNNLGFDDAMINKMCTILERMCAVDPDERMSMEEVVATFENF